MVVRQNPCLRCGLVFAELNELERLKGLTLAEITFGDDNRGGIGLPTV